MATKKTAPAKKKVTKTKPKSIVSKAKNPATKIEDTTKPIKKATAKKHNTKIGATKPTGPFGIQLYKAKKGEEYMNKAQLEHFSQILERWKQQLAGEMDRTVMHMQQDAANFPDPVDRASQEEEFSLELRTRDRERKLIRKIDEALERIKDGEYGFCLDCGADIGISRLEARPTATQCIECKTIAEIKEKQTGTSGFEE